MAMAVVTGSNHFGRNLTRIRGSRGSEIDADDHSSDVRSMGSLFSSLASTIVYHRRKNLKKIEGGVSMFVYVELCCM